MNTRKTHIKEHSKLVFIITSAAAYLIPRLVFNDAPPYPLNTETGSLLRIVFL